MINLTKKVNNECELLPYFIAENIIRFKSLMISWSDDEGSEYDILFSLPPSLGNTEKGLVISLIGYTCFVVDINKYPEHESYYADKMKYPRNLTLTKLCTLLNSVKEKLAEKI